MPKPLTDPKLLYFLQAEIVGNAVESLRADGVHTDVVVIKDCLYDETAFESLRKFEAARESGSHDPSRFWIVTDRGNISVTVKCEIAEPPNIILS